MISLDKYNENYNTVNDFIYKNTNFQLHKSPKC